MSDRYPWAKLKSVYIDGIEVTQSIQCYKSGRQLTDRRDRKKDSSIKIIANKPAWIRLYIHNRFPSPQTITGEIRIDRSRPSDYILHYVTTLSPQPPGKIITQFHPTYASERSNLLSSLNFIIPQHIVSNDLRLYVKIWINDTPSTDIVDTYTINLDANLLQTLRLRGIMISYNRLDPTADSPPPIINLPAPTVTDLHNGA